MITYQSTEHVKYPTQRKPTALILWLSNCSNPREGVGLFTWTAYHAHGLAHQALAGKAQRLSFVCTCP